MTELLLHAIAAMTVCWQKILMEIPPASWRSAVVRGEPPGFRQRYVSVADGTFRLVDMTCFVNSI